MQLRETGGIGECGYPAAKDFAMLRVLLVEDEILVALDVEAAINTVILATVIIKASVSEALRELENDIDFAILDVDVTNGKTYAVAECLQEHEIPFVFLSGSNHEHLPSHLQWVPFIAKPFTYRQIEQALLGHGEPQPASRR